ncbi:lytic transglycosylase domain-containing protein [Zavarzinia sp.]|uniref:lytic transglycosylase domain-containing protein n=1 Tax=Zavarzinia sp. TaxID=2027920 RepID=UPI003BB5C32D
MPSLRRRASKLAGFALLLLLPGIASLPPPADAAAATERSIDGREIDRHIAAASQAFSLPEAWIRAVIRAESGGDPDAVSTAGAMGLMQVMPETWADLRARYALGADPFDPCDNVMAGTAYLREMYDRFGAFGFLAAYHAGPGRYTDHLSTGRALPPETVAYVAALQPAIDGTAAIPATGGLRPAGDAWAAAPIFIITTGVSSADDRLVPRQQADSASDDGPMVAVARLAPVSSGIFISGPHP